METGSIKSVVGHTLWSQLCSVAGAAHGATRRRFFGVIAAAFGGGAIAGGFTRHVILDYRNMSRFEREFCCGRCLVDGKEIPLVWYVDTRRGFVKTYDVNDTHKPVLTTCWGLRCAPLRARTVYGNVELFRRDGSRL